MTGIRHRSSLSCKGAILLYERLCRDPQSGPYNVWSALPIVTEGLQYARRLYAFVQTIAMADHPVNTRDLSKMMRCSMKDAAVAMCTLMDYELLMRIVSPCLNGGREFFYVLSPFGRMVIHEANRKRA